jgi:RimJ/RimL family protein N-acetyltransferase
MRQNVNHLYNVYLRTWDQDDIEGYAELLGDPQTMQYISAGTTRNRDTAAAEITRFQQEIAQQGWSRWAVSLGLDSPFIGYAGFAEKEYGINFGNRFLKKYWGSPYPFTAIHLALEHGFLQLGFDQIYTLTNIKHHRALEMNRAFLHLPEISGTVMETPFGPHLKVDLTRERFMEISPLNRARIDRFSRRLTRSHAPA